MQGPERESNGKAEATSECKPGLLGLYVRHSLNL